MARHHDNERRCNAYFRGAPGEQAAAHRNHFWSAGAGDAFMSESRAGSSAMMRLRSLSL